MKKGFFGGGALVNASETSAPKINIFLAAATA
jgi:hypothetical protein